MACIIKPFFCEYILIFQHIHPANFQICNIILKLQVMSGGLNSVISQCRADK